MSSNYQQKKMMNALGAIDTKGNIVLEQFQDGTALLFQPGNAQPFCVATDYDRATASWSYGKYFSDLGCAHEAADPEIIEDASVRWVKEDIREKLKAQDIAPTEFNVQSVIMGDSRLWERPLDRDFRDNMIASGNDDLDARVTILKENGNFKNVDTAIPVESLDDLEQYRSDRLTDKVTSLKDSLDTFMGSDIHAKIDKITLDQDMSLFGKIVAIVPDSVKSGYQCLDVDAAGQSSGTLVHLYGADGSGTNYTQRNFIMGLGAMDERGGITFTIFPAHVKGFSRVLNASGGRGYLEQAAQNRTAPSSTQTLQLYGDDNTIAGRFWVTKSVDKNGRYNIISDASGFAFDQADGKTAEGTIVRLHSDGILGSEWSNEAHKWRIEEVFFKGTISLDAERVEPGKTISVIDPSKTCTPYDQGGTGSVKYLYRWYWMQDERESPFAENKYPEAFTLSSWCHLASCGDQIWRDAYAGAGYPVRDTNFFVESFKLRIKYGSGFIENNADFGAICYAGCMGIENSGDFSWSDVRRDGEELGKGGVSNRITGIKIWLEGDIAKEYDIAYRAFIYGQGWTERFHSNGGSQDDAELCGSDDASGSKGAIKCIQVFAIPKPRGAKLAREFAEDNSFIPENSHSGGYLTAQAMLALNLDDTSGFDGHKMIVDAYQGDSSKGLEALPVPPAPPVPVGIKVFYYVDGETDPCFEEEYKMGTTYQVNPDATAAGQKDNCLDLVCWYTDPEYTQPYEPQALDSSLKLYGYNPCSVKYDTTTRSSVLDTSYNWSTDADLGTALDLAALYPQDEIVKYGTKLTFAGPWSAWCEDAGKTRCVSSTPGVYATAAASGSPILSATIKGNTTVYVDWPWSGYDGVMSARS